MKTKTQFIEICGIQKKQRLEENLYTTECICYERISKINTLEKEQIKSKVSGRKK